tara:strand:+ start:378 stop:524 length:147 start_codon:yes stop_codon:yes gene_type:complete
MNGKAVDTEKINNDEFWQPDSESTSKWVYIGYFIFWISYSILLNLWGC